MSIDWITVAAQIANFLVLIWLLKRFLYRPILDGIDAREAEISNRMQDAATAKSRADELAESYHSQVQDLHVAQAEMTETIRKQAQEQRDVLLADAHAQMEREQSDWQSHLDEETRKYTAKLHSAGAGALLSLTRKALTDLADDTLETRMAHHLIQKIKPMTADMTRAAGGAGGAVFTSHTALPAETQTAITNELRAAFPEVSVRFDTDDQQAPGLILRMGGGQVAWTVETYIDGLDAMIADQLSNGPDPKGAVQ